MVPYRRSRVAGGTFFVTVNLRDRRHALLSEHFVVVDWVCAPPAEEFAEQGLSAP
jgi:hypothetical protein